MSTPTQPKRLSSLTLALAGIVLLALLIGAAFLMARPTANDEKPTAPSASTPQASGPTQGSGPVQPNPGSSDTALEGAGANAPTDEASNAGGQRGARTAAIQFSRAYINHAGDKAAWLRRISQYTTSTGQGQLNADASKATDRSIEEGQTVVVSPPDETTQNVIVQGDKHALGLTLTQEGTAWKVTDVRLAPKGSNTYDTVWVG